VLAEHKAIMDAALARDTSLATSLLAEHLGRTTAMVLDGMIDDGADAPPVAAAAGA
jgi:DNA-binding GntR family transcriptional regulator